MKLKDIKFENPRQIGEIMRWSAEVHGGKKKLCIEEGKNRVYLDKHTCNKMIELIPQWIERWKIE